jgi:hypothetical protein
MNVTFTLTGGSASTAAGPFNISGTTSSNVVSELATGITKAQLLTGHTINSINDAITGGTIASTGTCTTTDTWAVYPQTATLSYSFEAGYYYFSLSEALADDITITYANVNGHTSAGCQTASEDQANVQSPVLIEAGITNVNHDSGVGGWGGITYINPDNQITLTTYGQILNGNTFTTPSGTVVTVAYNDDCRIYAQ